MREFLKKFCHVIVAAFVAWYGYGALDEGSGMKAGAAKLDRIPASALELRGAEDRMKLEGDPFFRDWAPYGPEYGHEAIAARKRAEQDVAKAKLTAERQRQQEVRDAKAAEAVTARRSSGGAGFHPFVLRLDGVLALSGGGVATISGQRVRVGKALKGLDPNTPPVLSAIRGSTVEITYRGETIRLDITGRREHRVRQRPAGNDAPPPSDG